MAKRSTLKDVARTAQVSSATVSYVINGHTGGNIRVSDETRDRVWAAVESLNYRPNVAAQSLRTQRTRLLALMVPDLTNPFYPQLLRGISSIAEQKEYQVLVYDCEDLLAREQSFVDMVLRRQVDGVVMVSFFLTPEDVAPLVKARTKIVTLGEQLILPHSDAVIPEQLEATKQAVFHLVERGHRKIAHIAGAQDTPPGQMRLAGYREALADSGLSYDERLVRIGSFQRTGIAELVASLFASSIERSKRPTAIFAANDLMAIEAIRALKKLALRVPDDVAVCGFDNIPEAEVVDPPLTTVDQNPLALGQGLARLLLEQLESPEPQTRQRVFVPCSLVLRDST